MVYATRASIRKNGKGHYDEVIMAAMASQIISLTIIYSTVYSDADQRKHQSSASLAFVREMHRGPVNSPHKWPVTRKMSLFGDVIMKCLVAVAHMVYMALNVGRVIYVYVYACVSACVWLIWCVLEHRAWHRRLFVGFKHRLDTFSVWKSPTVSHEHQFVSWK